MEDVCDELALMDDDAEIPYRVGDSFVKQDLEKTQVFYLFIYNVKKKKIFIDLLFQKCLELEKQKTLADIAELASKTADLKGVMTDLKAQLYAKFGTHINLEAEED